MKNSLLILAGAAALSLASCSQEKTSTVTATPGAADGTATTTPESDAAVEARAQRIADKMVANMKITDEATRTKIRTVYVNRAKRMGELKTKYASDTTGMAAALRDATAATDSEFKVIFVEPTQYQTYESSRSTYDDSNYPAEDATTSASADTTGSAPAVSTTDAASAPAMAAGTDDATVTKLKAKDADGSKIKVKDNGKVKVKAADGTKTKN